MVEELERRKDTPGKQEIIERLKAKMARNNNDSSYGMSHLLANVEEKANHFVYSDDIEKDVFHHSEKMDLSKRAFSRELADVIESSDVIIEVLDARDPLTCRSFALESNILSSNREKKLILLLNKIDLVDFENALAWQSYFRREYPCIIFRANTQAKTGSLGRIDSFSAKMGVERAEDLLKTNRAIGADELVQLLKNYCRVDDVKKMITVGIVGFPNVGKSSVINSLKRQKAVGVSATPGFTKVKQSVNLDKNIKLLDCPGVVFDRKNTDDLVLKNVAKVEEMNAPELAEETAINKLGKQLFIDSYGVSDFETVTMFLALVADKAGKLSKGGIPDQDKAARMVLRDLYGGKIRFMTYPPDMCD